jgi:hypothetical protein
MAASRPTVRPGGRTTSPRGPLRNKRGQLERPTHRRQSRPSRHRTSRCRSKSAICCDGPWLRRGLIRYRDVAIDHAAALSASPDARTSDDTAAGRLGASNGHLAYHAEPKSSPMRPRPSRYRLAAGPCSSRCLGRGDDEPLNPASLRASRGRSVRASKVGAARRDRSRVAPQPS